MLTSRDQAGTIVGYSLNRMHIAGIVLGVLFLVVRLLRSRALGSLAAPAAWLVAVMIILTVISQFSVSARMAALRSQMGSIQATAADNQLLAEFSRLHRISVSLESGVLLAGLAATFFLVREFAARQG